MSAIHKRLAGLSPEKRELLLKKLQAQKKPDQKNRRITKRKEQHRYPISSSQMRLWFMNQLDPDSAFYNIPSAIRLTGNIDLEILRKSIHEIIRRHEVLRAGFMTNEKGEAEQIIVSNYKIDIPKIDISNTPAAQMDQRIQELLKEDAAKPFDLTNPPLIRSFILKIKPGQYVLSLDIHHIVTDGWSIGIIINEIISNYRILVKEPQTELPDLHLQYADYAAWQAERAVGNTIEKQLQYWKNALSGMPDFLDLYTDYPRPDFQTYNGRQHLFTIKKALTEKMRRLSREQGVSLYALIMAVFQVFLHKVSGQDDFGVGAPIANRNRAEIESIIGLFVNTVVLRADFRTDMTFAELIQRVKNDVITASDNQDVPFEKIVESVSGAPQLGHSPLFQVMFDLQTVPFERVTMDSITLEIVDIEVEVAKFDLLLLMLEHEDHIKCTFEYNRDLFSEETISRFSSYFHTLLKNALNNPSEKISNLSLISEKEQTRILTEWNQTATNYPADSSIPELFEQQVAKTPDAIAVRYDSLSYTYKELNSKSNQLAHLLIEKGVEPGHLVALYMERSMDMIIGFLAILKAGAAYVPLDISYPKDRLSFILKDTEASLLLTKTELLDDLPEGSAVSLAIDNDQLLADYSAESLAVLSKPLDRAYIIYTSGSTGIPKGVIVPHRAVIRLVINTDYVRIKANHNIAQASNAAFDAATFEIWGALLNGARLVAIPKDVMLSTQSFIQALKDKEISHLFLTTALFNQIAAENSSAFKTLDTVMFGGEMVDPSSVRKIALSEPPQNLLHVYGPTENTTFSTWYKVKKIAETDTNVPIGKPIANSTMYVFNKKIQVVPIGIPGELYVGGDGLALEYLKRKELTAERFIKNPFDPSGNSMLYKTGDLVRWLPDGNIEFLARIDQQVKIRGFRIELGEIESVLKTNPLLKDAVVLARQDNPGDKVLTAYIVPNEKQEIKTSVLRAFLLEKLPDYMVPFAWVEMDSIPLTPNGKVDKNALPAPGHARPDMEAQYTAPRNNLEQFLSEIWGEILTIDRVGIHDNFFELGGNSLKAAVFANRLQKEFGEVTHVSVVFKAPTIAELAGYIVNYYPQLTRERFELDESVHQLYKLIDVAEEVVHKIGQPQIDTIRKIITPLPQRTETDSTKNPSAIFVLSPPRSGSTLLRVMLAGNQKLFSPPELDLLSFNTVRERREAFSEEGLEIWLEATIRAIKELKQTDVDEARRIMDGFVAQNMSVKEYYRTLQEWMGDRILVDKSPTYPFDPEILKRAEQDFTQAKYIHLLRHPYAMVYSFIEAKLDQNFFRYEHPFTRRELGELIYIISHQNINRFLQDIPDERKIRLRFEDLLLDPYNEMLRICNFIDIDFEPDMLKPYQGNKMTDGVSKHSQMVGDFKFYLHKNIDTSVTDRWREHHKNNFLSDITWELAKAFGYPVEKNIAHSQSTAIQGIPVIPRTDELPLSFAQQRLWFLDQMEPGNPQYNIPGAIRLKGTLDVEKMLQALNLIVQRHENLRTIFRSSAEGKASQVILPQLKLDLPVVDSAGVSDSDLILRANQESAKPFDLSKAPLIRAKLFKISDQEYILMITVHHIISDGWSVNVLVRELSLIYNALIKDEPIPLTPLQIQYADFAAWQRQWLSGSRLENEMTFWKKQLDGASFFLELPTDFPRPAMVSYQGKRLVHRVPDALYQQLNQLSKEHETTLFMVLLTAFETLLYRYSGQDDFTIGTPVANRNRREIEPLIGFFVNTLVLRSTINKNRSFRHHLRLVKKIAMDAFDHQDMPFEKLVDTLQPEREMNHTPLFQVMFSMQHSDIQEIHLEELSYSPFAIETETAKFDLNLEIIEHTNRMVAILEYKTSLFKEETIQRIMGHFTTLLESIVRNPDQNISELPLLKEEEQHKMLVEWRPAMLDYPTDKCLHHLIEKQAKIQPQQFAAGINDETLNFEQLNARANQVASFLLKSGVKQESIIGILMERSTDMIVSMLAIWKAGCAYLPLDPAYPEERLDFMLTDAHVPFLLTHSETVTDLALTNTRVIALDTVGAEISNESVQNPNLTQSTDSLAYIIYTSGSTGKPKGVMISHKSALHLAENLKQTIYSCFGNTKLKISLNAPIPFDASVQQIVMLAHGHGLQIIPMETRGSGDTMLDYIRKYKIQVLDCVPAQLKLLLDAGLLDADEWKPLAVLPGGEAIDEVTWKKLVDSKDILFFNMYGPTECTVDSTICNVQSSPLRPVIGKPVSNARFYILDQSGQPVPVGAAGELYIAGDGLARGYLNRPELTAEKFIADPFCKDKAARMYKTGDLVRWLSDGNVEFLGRVDHQVKLRGFRMELGEIESRLREHESVKDAVVLVREVKEGDKRLAAYLVAERDKNIEIPEIRSFLKETLPEYMVPAAFVTLNAFPLLPNGKVNRRALPEPEFDRSDLGTEFIEASTDKEKILSETWKAVLGIEQIGTRDNFFELGGDSILSIQVVARAGQAGLRITPKQMFENPTIESLAAVAEQTKRIEAEQGTVSGPVLLSPIQIEFFNQNHPEPWHWNQSLMLEAAASVDETILSQVIKKIVEHHDALRLRFWKTDQIWQAKIEEKEESDLISIFDLSKLEEPAQSENIHRQISKLQSSLNLETGPIIKAAIFKRGSGKNDLIFIAVHHLAVDGLSWRILSEDMQTAYGQLTANAELVLPAKTTSFKQWTEKLSAYADNKKLQEEIPYWNTLAEKRFDKLVPDFPDGENTEASAAVVSTVLDETETEYLLRGAHTVYNTQINDILLTALIKAFKIWSGHSRIWLAMEGHGREDIMEEVSLARTVGWFTSMYPVFLDLSQMSETGKSIIAVKEQLRNIPNNGIGFGILKYLRSDFSEKLKALQNPEIVFNYLGQFQPDSEELSLFKPLAGFNDDERSPRSRRSYLLEISASIKGKNLLIDIMYSKNQFRTESIKKFLALYEGELIKLLAFLKNDAGGVYTPSDFQDVDLNEEALEDLFSELDED